MGGTRTRIASRSPSSPGLPFSERPEGFQNVANRTPIGQLSLPLKYHGLLSPCAHGNKIGAGCGNRTRIISLEGWSNRPLCQTREIGLGNHPKAWLFPQNPAHHRSRSPALQPTQGPFSQVNYGQSACGFFLPIPQNGNPRDFGSDRRISGDPETPQLAAASPLFTCEDRGFGDQGWIRTAGLFCTLLLFH